MIMLYQKQEEGIYGPRLKYHKSLGTLTSIFQAEIYAIVKCIEVNLARGYKNHEIAILTDSQAAIKALSAYEVNSKLVWECLGKLNELGKKNKVTIYWVPGHLGIPGNEKADELARKGSSNNLQGPEPFCGVGKGTINMNLAKEENAERNKWWAQTTGANQAKQLIGSYDKRRTEVYLNQPKGKLKMLVGLLTGHCRLNKHMHRLGITNCETCRYCMEDSETSEHVLMNCPAFSRTRMKYLGKQILTGSVIPKIPLRDILDYIREIGIEEEI